MADPLENGTAVLDLDALYGEAHPVSVKWQGVKYTLRTFDQMTARDAVRLDALKREMRSQSNLAVSTDATDDVEAAQLEHVTNEMLRLVSPELAALGLSFMPRFRVLNFYMDEMNRRADGEKKMTADA